MKKLICILALAATLLLSVAVNETSADGDVSPLGIWLVGTGEG